MILNSKMAERIQDGLFKQMTAEEKIKMISHFFEFAKKLNKLNDRRLDGNRTASYKNSKNIR